jgi:folate-binding protein YgfZ
MGAMTRADAAADYAAVRTRVGLVDHGDAGVLEVTGRDRASFLHAMLSNDIKALQPGQGCQATFLDVHGKVQTLLVVLALDDRMLLVTPPGLAAKTLESLDRYLFSEKVAFVDASEELALLVLAGPQAPATAARLTGASLPDAAWSHVAAMLDGVSIRLVRAAGETGEAEVWLVCAAGSAARVRDAVLAAGARDIGREALEALRIEAGTPRYGADVDHSVLLPEIPLEPFVSYTKGCYIGQEVVVRIRDRGHVNRHLCGLVLEGEEVPAPGAAVLVDDGEVGRVTSAAWSPGRRRPVALALVRRQHAEPGTPVTVRTPHGAAPATVTALPMP